MDKQKIKSMTTDELIEGILWIKNRALYRQACQMLETCENHMLWAYEDELAARL